MFFFMEIFYNILFLVVLVLVGWLLWWKREAVLVLLSGDNKIHWSRYDTIFWGFFKCCGLVQWESTRLLSKLVCRCEACGIFSKKHAGRNLVRLLGEWLGLVPTQVLVENVVVGDLPAFWSRSRVYLQVDVGDNPSQVSEVLEDCNPKVAHFNTRFTLDILRHGHGEPVRFAVRELFAFTQRDICECYINQADIIDWSGAGWQQRPQGPLRFRMYPKEEKGEGQGAASGTLPSWIFLEFTLPDEQPAAARVMGKFGLQLVLSNGDVIDTESAKQFKADYQLLSSTGEPRGPNYEPDEDVVSSLRDDKVRVLSWVHSGCKCVLLFWLVFFCAITYYGACWREFAKVVVLMNDGLKFPVPEEQKLQVLGTCHLNSNSFFWIAKVTFKKITGYVRWRLSILFWDPRESQDPLTEASANSTSAAAAQKAAASMSACKANGAMVHEQCDKLPAGAGTVMFPAPFLDHFVQCVPALSCKAQDPMGFFKDVLDIGLVMLVLLFVLGLGLRVWYQWKEQRALRFLNTGGATGMQ